jgi:DNA-binding MarR family transcriptional regulator/N-acetylglutamate synthase-like GNAT family acetyltransferase
MEAVARSAGHQDGAKRPAGLHRRIGAVRRFNRDYTRRIGVLREGLLDSPFSLTQARVLYELAHRQGPTAAELCDELGLDPGYLSRTLSAFARQGLVTRQASKTDGRRSLLALTARGRRVFATLDAGSASEVRALLEPLPVAGQERLVAAMAAIEGLLGGRPASRAPLRLRAPRPGDMGWVIERHGAVYDREWGWGEKFEALVAEIVVGFMKRHDPRRERAWIAEHGGQRVGSIFLVAKSPSVAKLRLLLVEPDARGLGVGQRLVGECVRFARAAGYRKVVLWTQSILDPARHIYAKMGFRLVGQEPNHEFGSGLISETWELLLSSRPRRRGAAAPHDS